jgi:hypothetical protein
MAIQCKTRILALPCLLLLLVEAIIGEDTLEDKAARDA